MFVLLFIVLIDFIYLIRVQQILFYLTEKFSDFFEIGQHFYWTILNYQVHGQVLLNTWLVILIVLVIGFSSTRSLKLIPEDGQSFVELLTEFVRGIAKDQMGEKNYSEWVPYIGTLFVFIFVSNWSGALIPWKVLELPNGELGAPTNDMYVLKLIF